MDIAQFLTDVPQEILAKADLHKLRAYYVAMTRDPWNLLSVSNDAKTPKGEKYGILTGVMYLAPAQTSGVEVCPGRTRGCTAACLFTAGQGRFPNVIEGRLRRTYQWIYRPEEFLIQLHQEIGNLIDLAEARGMTPAIRLNGTSDIAWEHHTLPYQVTGGEDVNIFQAFPNQNFYDYTKRFDRLAEILDIPNYHVTFSRAETKKSHNDAVKALEMGINVTVVFGGEKLPEEYFGYKVKDGDETDIRFWDDDKDGPYIIGLSAKGKARTDKTGFVIWPEDIT